MKEIFDKKIVFGIIIGGIVFGVLGVTASNMYQANQVSYKDGNVDDALNQLYDVTNLKQEIEELKTQVNNKTSFELLWENPDPSAAFEPQKVTLSSSEYDVLQVWFYTMNSGSNPNYTHSDIIMKGKNTSIEHSNGAWGTSSNPIRGSQRNIICISDTEYEFKGGYYYTSTGILADNHYSVPIKIYGIKY